MSNGNPPISPDTERPTRYRSVVFCLACGTSWFLYLHRYVFGLIKPQLTAEFDLNKTQLGYLESVFTIFYAGCQVPVGLAVDSVGVRAMLTLSIYVWCLGLAGHALASGLWMLVAARAVFGAGQSGVYAAINRLTRTWFPSARRTTVQGWAGVFFGRIGGVSSNLLVLTVMLGMFAFTWRLAVYVLVGFGLLHTLAFFLLYRNSPREHARVNDAEACLIEEKPPGDDEGSAEPAPRLKMGEMLSRMTPRSRKNLLCLNGQTILSTIADNIFSSWIPLFLSEVHNLKFKEMGIYSALPLLGGACGGAVGGWLNDFFIRKTGNRRWSRTGVGLAGKGLAALVLLSAVYIHFGPQHDWDWYKDWHHNPYRFCGMLFFVKFFSDWSLTTTWGTVTDIGGQSPATVFAWNNAIATTGAILAPIMYGFIADHDPSWMWVFVAGSVAYTLCALSWLAVDCRIPVIEEPGEAEV